MTDGKICFANQQERYVLKFIGEIRCTLGCTFDRFLDELFKEARLEEIQLDLSEAEMIDSTCLGLLARVANEMRKTTGKKTTLVSTRPDINQLLQNVSFDQVFNITDQPAPALVDETCLFVNDSDTACMAETVLTAHHLLSEISDDNREAFKDVIKTVESSLQK